MELEIAILAGLAVSATISGMVMVYLLFDYLRDDSDDK